MPGRKQGEKGGEEQRSVNVRDARIWCVCTLGSPACGSQSSPSPDSNSSSDGGCPGERPVPYPPLGLERNRRCFRLQTHPARVGLLRPCRSLGLAVDLPKGTAFTRPRAAPLFRRSPRRVLPVLGGRATAVYRAPDSGASSPNQRPLQEKVLDSLVWWGWEPQYV